MAIEVFIPPKCPERGESIEPSARVRATQFGDGYVQRTPDGLNSTARKLMMRLVGLSKTQKIAVETFFEARAGATPFLYTARAENSERQWICGTWPSQEIGPNRYAMSLTFDEDFSIQ